MPGKYIYNDEIFYLDDSKGCYVEVMHNEKVTGYVGVNLRRGTDSHPYAFAPRSNNVRPDGILGVSGRFATIDEGIDWACQYAIDEQKRRREFDPAKACDEMHRRIKALTA